ncbi:putative two-component system sensor kinase [Actinoplanes sp. N902-109]|nr:putative two-component system sensor kinase [Actinoplanes sp. N902-109]
MAFGVLGIFLSVLNFPLLVLWLVAVALLPVAGIGMVALPFMTWLLRARVGLARRWAAGAGVPIAVPYTPAPRNALPAGWRRYKWILTDPTTWRDVAWLVPGAILGILVGGLALGVPAYGVQGIILLPLWIYLGTDWYGYGLFWPIDNVNEGLMSLPQGVVILAIGLLAAPRLRLGEALFARLLLAPTKSAELRLRVAHLTETRADTVDAQAAELRRIERDLHDGAQARLVSLGMTIGLAEELLDRDSEAVRKLLVEARETSGFALTELRHLVRGIHPPVLAERGLDGAIRALAISLPLPISVDIDVAGRPETPVESAAYFAVAEALTNVVRHSAAHTAAVTIRHSENLMSIVVLDDGHGGADPGAGTGLRGMERRLAAFDGTMTLSSPPGGPTVVTLELPCALSSPKTLFSSGTG